MKINLRACRICLRVQSKTLAIFKDCNSSIADSIFLISGIIIEPLDKKLPLRMCRKCSNSITKAVEVRDLCIKSDKALKSSLPKKTQMVEVIVEVERHEIKAEYLETYLEDFASDNDNFPSPETTSQAVDTKPEIKVEDDSDDSMEDNLLALLGEKEEDLIIPVKKPPRKRSKPLPKPPKIDDDGVVVKKKKKPMDPAREYSFQCLFCGKFMKTPSSLKTHEHVVHQEHFVKPTESLKCICDLCGAVLGKKPYMKAHMKSVHIKVKQFNCLVCQKGFSKKCNWIQHQMMHNNQYRFQCTYCSKGFVKKARLEIHTRIHTGERPFKCDQCEKTYAHDTDLRRHLWGHSGKRPYSCTFCQKGFIKKSSLSLHMRTHTGEKGLNCELCSKTFTTRQTYIFHIERCGKKGPTEYIPGSEDNKTLI